MRQLERPQLPVGRVDPALIGGLRELAGRLQQRCDVGGSVEDGVTELQGHRAVVMEVLRADGYDGRSRRRQNVVP